MSETDLQLLTRYASQRAEDAFSEIVRRHVDLVHSAALRQVRSRELAEEVAQAVFVELARQARHLPPRTVLAAWLYHVTRRRAIDTVRREAGRRLREQTAQELQAMNATAEDWTHIEPLLDDAMDALEETDRLAVLLRYFQNKPLHEVGEAIGVTDDAAQKRVSRAVERLREFFAKRGVTIGTSGLVVVISANAVQAAPAGLAVTISTLLAGTTVVTTAIATKAIALTTLKKTFIGVILAAVVGLGIYEAVIAILPRHTPLSSSGGLKTSIPELPKEPGKSVILKLPGLSATATKLEFVSVAGRGATKRFLLGKYEVTQGQYQALMATNPSVFKYGPNYPVENMAWQDAKDFCLKFNACLAPDDGARVQLRLPTDAEWSIAVGLPEEVAGTPQQKSRKVKGIYPWGAGFPPTVVVGNYSDETRAKRTGAGTRPDHLVGYDDGYADTSPVGSFPPNKFGICDLGGNVWEWCEDWLDDEMNLRVVRGAGWWDHSEGQMVASYRGRVPALRNSGAGFRVCLEVISK